MAVLRYRLRASASEVTDLQPQRYRLDRTNPFSSVIQAILETAPAPDRADETHEGVSKH